LAFPITHRGATLQVVQRLFAMFPEGGPGVALLLLRISVAAMLLIGNSSARAVLASHWAIACLVLVAISLCFGFLTPIFSVLVCVFDVAGIFIAGRFDSPAAFLPILNPLALSLLGPGAYSLDARIFGRRVLIVSSGTDLNRR
jgi:uncharacterized membrane protein YphA (DoxX/SURF4 family)